jgi:hypothetical protein
VVQIAESLCTDSAFFDRFRVSRCFRASDLRSFFCEPSTIVADSHEYKILMCSYWMEARFFCHRKHLDNTESAYFIGFFDNHKKLRHVRRRDRSSMRERINAAYHYAGQQSRIIAYKHFVKLNTVFFITL